MKLAYLILVHKNPLLLERAIRTLSIEDSAFFIHVDKKASIQPFSGLAGDNVFLHEPRLSVCWGEFSQVEATIRLISKALGSTVKYDYFTFLQGSDYPLRSAHYIRKFLEEHRGSEFMNLLKIPGPGYPLSKINTLRYSSDLPIRRFFSRGLAALGYQRNYMNSLKGLDAYAGQAYWTLSREACEYILEFDARSPHIKQYFKDAFTSDEMYFHTILGNSPLKNRIRRSIAFVDPNWSITGDLRHMVKIEHIKYFESQQRTWTSDEWGAGEVLFARKFSDDTLDLIDRIDAMIRQKGND